MNEFTTIFCCACRQHRSSPNLSDVKISEFYKKLFKNNIAAIATGDCCVLISPKIFSSPHKRLFWPANCFHI